MKKGVIVLLLGMCLLAGCDVFDKTAQNEFETATKLWNAGDYQNAVKLYFALVKEHPSSSRADEALYWAGVTQFLYLGETEKALQTFRLLLKRYPNRGMAPAAQWYIAQIYELGYSDYERAAAEYRKASEYSNREVNGPQSRLANYRLGTAAFAKGDLKNAESFYRKTLENGTDKELAIKAKFALAGCFEAGDNLAGALKLYKEIEPEYANPEAIRIKIRALETRIMKKSY